MRIDPAHTQSPTIRSLTHALVVRHLPSPPVDVLDLHNWMAAHGDAHPAFERVPDAELAADPCVAVMRTYTEEGKKVERNEGDKFVAVFRRLSTAAATARADALSGGDFWTEPAVHYEHVRAVKAPPLAGKRGRDPAALAEARAAPAAAVGTSSVPVAAIASPASAVQNESRVTSATC